MFAQDWLALLAILICLALSFFFSGSETALTAFSRARMLRMEKAGNRRAAIVNRLLDARERLIGGILIGNNVANIAASSLATGLMLLAALSFFTGLILDTVVRGRREVRRLHYLSLPAPGVDPS